MYLIWGIADHPSNSFFPPLNLTNANGDDCKSDDDDDDDELLFATLYDWL